VRARKTLAKLLVSLGTRLLAEERKATVWQSELMAGIRLSPLACGGVVPKGTLARTVTVVQVVVTVAGKPRQVLRTKMFSTPLAVLETRLEAFEAKTTNSPTVDVEETVALWPMLGYSLRALPGVVPSGVEIRVADGLQVVVVTPRHVSNM